MAQAELEAVRDAIAGYLEVALTPLFPSLVVLSEWPDGQELPEMAISVLPTGEADIVPHAPRIVSTAPNADPDPGGVVTYSYGYAEEVPLVLDVWTNSAPKRDALVAALRDALNRPPVATIAGASSTFPMLLRRAYLSLAVPGLFGAIFTYRFAQVPVVPESSLAAEKNEWRASFRGAADGALLAQETFPLLRRAHLAGQVGPGPKQPVAIDQPLTQALTIVTPSGPQLAAGDTLQLSAAAVFPLGVVRDATQAATWSSDAPAVASVGPHGLVQGVSSGTAHITAVAGGIPGGVTVTVL